MATITIDSSNYPHGVLQFSPTSLDIVKEEQDITINLQIERKFGNIGNVISTCSLLTWTNLCLSIIDRCLDYKD